MAQRYTEPEVRKIVEDDTDHEYSLLHVELVGKKNKKTGKAMKREMTIKHNNCGHIYTIDIYEFCSEGKRRCGKGKGLRKHFVESIESIKKKTKDLTDGEYSFIDDHYINSKIKHWFQHTTCKTKFKKTWDKFKGTPKQPGQRCPECSKKGMESIASRYVRDVSDHLHVEYECEKRFDGCRNPKTGRILPFDYYLPKINTLIEVDGEQHERGSSTKYDHEGTVKRDKVKNKYVEKKGIELVRIPPRNGQSSPNSSLKFYLKILFLHLHWKKSKKSLMLHILKGSTKI